VRRMHTRVVRGPGRSRWRPTDDAEDRADERGRTADALGRQAIKAVAARRLHSVGRSGPLFLLRGSGSIPSSGHGAAEGYRDARGASALPASPAAGLLPIRPRPSRPAPDRESTTARSDGSLNHKRTSFEPETSAGHRHQCPPVGCVRAAGARGRLRLMPPAFGRGFQKVSIWPLPLPERLARIIENC